MNDRPSIRLDDLVTGWNETATEHRAALGDGWNLASTFLQLHGDAITRFSVGIGETPTEREQAAVLLAVHGYNLYVAVLGLIVRGQFDAAAYLMRPLLEMWVLFVAAARHDDIASKYLAGQLSTKDALKRNKTELANQPEDGAELSRDLDRTFRDEWKATSSISHVGIVHAAKLVVRADNVITPTVGGHVDREEAVRLCRAAHLQERRLLGFARGIFSPVLDADWNARYEKTASRYQEWMRATEEVEQS